MIASMAARYDGASSPSAGSSSRTSGRSADRSGAYGSSSSPSSTQSPASTRAPDSRACRFSSSASRDLPTPDSPPTKARDGRPSAASRSAASSSASCPARPTKWALVMRVLMVCQSCQPGRSASPIGEEGVDVDGVKAGVHGCSSRIDCTNGVSSLGALRTSGIWSDLGGRTPYRAKWKPYHCEGRPLRQLRASEADPHGAGGRVLDVPALEDRLPLPEVPAHPGGALSRLRAGRYQSPLQRVPLTMVLPSSATRTSGAASEMVPEKRPRGAGPPPGATAFALPWRPAATFQSILKSPACTAVTDQRNFFCSFGLSGPHAQVF